MSKDNNFELFKSECKKWIKKFGLTNWDVHYQCKEIEDAAGDCVSNPENMQALIGFNDEIHEIAEDVKRTALHEVLELLISRMNICAHERYLSYKEINEARHDLIRRLENFIIKKNKKGKRL